MSARLKTLQGKLEGRRAVEGAGSSNAPDSGGRALAQAFRLSSEFIAGILVGVGIGWLVDTWLDTSPWGLIVFLLLGFAAGVFNVLRAAGLMREPTAALRPRPDNGDEGRNGRGDRG